jgi:hypothetical protein
MSADGVPSACETFEYGEVEDYSVNIVEAVQTQAHRQFQQI